MRTTILLATLVIMACFSGFSQAQDNMMGLYFDREAQSACLDATTITPYAAFELYVMLLNPTFPALYGFEFGMSVEGPGLLIEAQVANPNFVDVGSLGNHTIGFGVPTPMLEVNVLLTFIIRYMSTDNENVCFILRGSMPSSLDPLYPTALLEGGVLLSMGVVPPGAGGCTATIDEALCSITPADSPTWGALKSMYR